MKWRPFSLTPSPFRQVSLLAKQLERQIHLISLQFDHAVLDSTANADACFELLQQRLEARSIQLQAPDHRHGFATFATTGGLHPHLLLLLGCGLRLKAARSLQALGTAEFLPASLRHPPVATGLHCR